MRKNLAKSIAVFFLIVILGYTAGVAAPIVKPGEIKISQEYGRITETFNGSDDKLVVHVQDAHTNYEAQKNSAHILEDLINQHGLYLILVEGGSRDVSLNRYREQYPMETRKSMAEESLKNGVIAGEEYLNIVSDYPMKLQGIEDRALYDQNMTAFLDVDKNKDNALLFTNVLSGIVSTLKGKLYNRALKELDEKRIGFKEAATSLNDYVKYLDVPAKSKRINLSAYPNYNNLISSVDIEKTIDFPAVEKERSGVIDALSKVINQDELNELLTKSVDFKVGRLSQAQYHNYLKGVMAKGNMDLRKHQNLDRYISYVTTYEKIDSTRLFKELGALEEAIGRALSVNDDQRRLLKISKDLELLVDFINLKLAPDDFDYYQKNEGDFNISVWSRFLNDQMSKYKMAQRIPENNQAVNTVIPSLKSFYATARKRDEIFLDNTKKYMGAEGVNIAVLIAGGFHTPTLMKLFRENNISYLVVSPKVIKPTDEKLYHKILTEGWAPSEGTGTGAQE
jgi:hypothetical protein